MNARTELQFTTLPDGRAVVIKRGPRATCEAEALRECEGSGVVPLLASGSGSLTLPWLDGESLAARLERGPLDADALSHLFLNVATTLNRIHDLGWLHNDVSPANLWLSGHDLVLLDFDAACREGEPQSLGTLHYMAPERHEAPPTWASDLYALGITLYEAASGRLPFEAQTPAEILVAHHRHWFIPLGELCPDLPPELVSAIEQLMERDPEKRALG
jgi:serine/threonine protein kinase